VIDATRTQDVAAVRALITERADVNATAADGSTALHVAAQRDHLALVQLLLGAGANPKATTRYNITPLYLAALNGNTAIMERLLDVGADPNGTRNLDAAEHARTIDGWSERWHHLIDGVDDDAVSGVARLQSEAISTRGSDVPAGDRRRQHLGRHFPAEGASLPLTSPRKTTALQTRGR